MRAKLLIEIKTNSLLSCDGLVAVMLLNLAPISVFR